MRSLLAALVRTVVIGVGLAAYYAALPTLFPDDGGGANIGAGLIAFGALALISFGWAFIDGRTRGIAPAIVIWAIAAGLFSVGWLVALAIGGADSSMSVTELIVSDLATLPFTLGLVIGPGAVGAAIGGALRPPQDR